MRTRLLFITSHYFYPLTVNALRRIAPDCDTAVMAYDDFDHIVRLYRAHAEEYDACFVSGVAVKRAIELNCPAVTGPLEAFQVSENGLHRAILRLALENQSLDFSRIAMDFLLPLGERYSVADYLVLDDLPAVIAHTHEQQSAQTSRGPRWIEERILERIRQLKDRNAIDLVICLYSGLIPRLEEMGIPYRCPFLADDHLKKHIESVLIRLEVQKLHDNHPAIIQVFPRHSGEDAAARSRALEQCIREFVRINFLDCVIQGGPDCCILITTMKLLRFLTGELQTCRITAYTDTHLDFPVSVAYGVGTSVPHAMNNVQIASREAKLLGSSFLVDTNGSLIGPLSLETSMVITSHSLPDTSQIAGRCGLSVMTIQKLMGIVRSTRSDKITTQALAQHLDTTVRNANRIILNLCKGKVARPVYTQPSHSRGRPVQVYSLDFGTALIPE